MTHLRYDSQTRTETNETVIATLVRKGWEPYTPEPVVEVPPLVTAETAVSAYFSAYQIAALQRLEMALMQAGKPLGPKMTAAKTWLETVLLSWAAAPTPAPAESFGQPQGGLASFEEASSEAVGDLQQL
jgi:hypothetical protein